MNRRLNRHQSSQGYNSIVQAQQFNMPGYVDPIGQRHPDQEYDDLLVLLIGGEEL